MEREATYITYVAQLLTGRKTNQDSQHQTGSQELGACRAKRRLTDDRFMSLYANPLTPVPVLVRQTTVILYSCVPFPLLLFLLTSGVICTGKDLRVGFLKGRLALSLFTPAETLGFLCINSIALHLTGFIT